ncbi:MAG: LPS export ABC transporter periplasmic protein LptC [bacterium]
MKLGIMFMMKLKILIFSLTILFLIGIISFLWVKKEGKIEKEGDEISSAEFLRSELALSGFHLVETIGGKPQWELFAKNASISKTKTNLEEIKCIFFSSKDNESILIVEAKRGILDTDTRDIELRGKVKATTKEGTEFTTDTFRWRAKSGIFITPGAVKIIHEKVHISGYGLEVDPEREKVEIKEQVKIIIESS